MASEEWYRQKINELRNEETRLDTLNQIKNHLYNKNPEVEIAINFLKAPEMFQCLDESSPRDPQLSEFVLDILSICMSTLVLDHTDYINVLQKSLSHSNAKVQSLALRKIIKYLEKHPDITSLDYNITLTILNYCLDKKETSVGVMAIKILSRILISCIDNNEIKNELSKRCNLIQSSNFSEIIRGRVYEICINLAKYSSTILNEVEIFLNHMLTELDGDDTLLKLNILELLVSLAEQNHGLVYLENKQIFEKISKNVEQISQNPLDTILIPGFMKFFGKIAYSQPQKIITGYPDMIQCLFSCLLSEDVSLLPTAFDTLGNLSHSAQGKILLEQNYSANLAECFQQIAVYLQNLPTDLKIRVFNALEIIFKTEGKITEEINNITQKWFQYMTGSTDLRFLLNFAKNPFPDIKTACLSFLKVLCEYHWGIIALRDTATFIEFLLDRRVEFDQNALYIKYEIIKILSETTVFDVQTILQLKKYVEEGVQYVEPIVEIAIEGS